MNWHPSIPELPELLTALREPTPGLMLLRFRSGLALRFLLDQLRKELPGRAVHEVPYAANSPDAPNGSPRSLVESCQAHANAACPVIVLLPDPNELHEVEPATTARFWKQLNAHREPLGNASAQVLLCVSEAQAPYAFSHALDLLSWCSPKFELPQVPQGSLVIVPEGSPAALAGSTEDAMRTLVATHGPLWEDIHTSGRQPSDSDLRQIYFPLVLALLDQHRLEEARQLLDQAPAVEALTPRARAGLLQLRGQLHIHLGETKVGVGLLQQALAWGQTEGRSHASDSVVESFVDLISDRLTVALAATGQLDQALSLAKDAMQRAESRRTLRGDTREILRALSVVHSRLGELLVAKGDLDEAGRHIAEDLRICEQILTLDPSHSQAIADLGVAHLKASDLYAAQGRMLDARASLIFALESTRSALVRAPDSIQIQGLLEAILTNLGYLDIQFGKPALATQRLLEAESLGEQVARNSPLHRESQSNLLTVRALLAQLFEQTDPPAAKTAWERLAHQIEAMESRGPLPPREAELLKLARTKSLA
jgi:tetratricopeptide (TPR) repeat protein